MLAGLGYQSLTEETNGRSFKYGAAAVVYRPANLIMRGTMIAATATMAPNIRISVEETVRFPQPLRSGPCLVGPSTATPYPGYGY